MHHHPQIFFRLSCSRIWNETWLAGFFYKPCNYELFVKQSLNMEMAIIMARVCVNGLFVYQVVIWHVLSVMAEILSFSVSLTGHRMLVWIGLFI